jgi:nucleotide-binding universal stress UspA family protein
MSVPGRWSTILVGTDFSTCSAAALRQALRLGALCGARVQVVHVIDVVVAVELEQALTALQHKIREGLQADARAAYETFAASIPGAGSLAFTAPIDSRSRGLLRAAEESRADLLVLGAWGERELEVGLGSIAQTSVRGARADVLLVRAGQSGPFRSVIAATDFSPPAEHAVDLAAWMASADRAPLELLHVLEPLGRHPLRWREAPGLLGAKGALEQAAALQRSRADAALAERVAQLRTAHGSLAVQAHLTDAGRHQSAISARARERAADLIVLGRGGRGGLGEWFLGTTAEKTLVHSPCSVWVAKDASAETPRPR